MLATLVIAMTVTGGCSEQAGIDDRVAPVDPVGVVYDELSDRFRLTAFPSTVYQDGSDVYVAFHATVVNKSPESFPDFYTTVIFDPELDQYFAAGVDPLPITRVDLFPEGASELDEGMGALGTELLVDQLVSSPTFLDEAGLEPSRVLDLAGHLTLWLRWEGGEETLEYDAPVVDPGNLPAP